MSLYDNSVKVCLNNERNISKIFKKVLIFCYMYAYFVRLADPIFFTGTYSAHQNFFHLLLFLMVYSFYGYQYSLGYNKPKHYPTPQI